MFIKFETDFRYAPDFERLPGEPKTITGHYSKEQPHGSGVVRKNVAGGWDAFMNGVCVRQTLGVQGARDEIDRRDALTNRS